jgi:isoleucyl-tRNA synthetase
MFSPQTTDSEAKKNYKQTLNLPQTTFEMQAKLVQNEPKRLQRWCEIRLYEKLMAARSGAPKWVLHDGPPFANGDIHIGHVINKTLKDVVLRFRTLQGRQTPYVPGWDCHGLPIEHKIQQDLGPKIREMSKLDVRRHCYAYADKYVNIQNEQFQRLGILGEWERPYLTMAPEYESSTLEVFAKFVEAGLVYRKLKPVHWSISNQTALADAELEYKDVEGPSIYVEFPVESSPEASPVPAAQHAWNASATVTHLLVWTTTPWTLPANLAVVVHPEVEYALVKYGRNGEERVGVVAKDLVERVFRDRQGVERYEVVGSVTGRELVEAKLTYRHPFVDRTGPVLPAKYVTTTDGTGLVHTAPGHGEEDYATGIAQGLQVYCPVLHNGRFDETVPEWIRGMTVWDADPVITKKLEDLGLLLAEEKITHSYPHDWRSKTPTIFRATEQWFVSMDQPFSVESDREGLGPKSLRDRARHVIGGADLDEAARSREELEAMDREIELRAREQAELRKEGASGTPIDDPAKARRIFVGIDSAASIMFVPKWGQNRILGMINSRPDWCISRQRAWGLPIPVFYNEQGEALLTPGSVRAVAQRFREKGSDAWFTDSPAELLGDHEPGPQFPRDRLRKESDIFDVWFESGSSWHAVLQDRSYLRFPADLYLEGSDQHRGWFQLSLLPSLGVTGQPPFRQVVTHGFIVKPDGTKVSKSDKEYVTATKEIDTHGADLLRLWCCSVDYQGDIPTSPKMIREFGDKYRKIRNTLRYLLSNLYDFNPAIDAQEIVPNSLDGWISHELDDLIREVTAAYDRYQLHRAFRLLHDFCTVEISSIYGNAMKDRLYCEAPDSPLRRRCQTVMHQMAIALTKLLSPMLVFTADEAWEHIPHKPAEEAGLPSVHLALLPVPSAFEPDDDLREEWRMLMELRESALLQLDGLKKQAGLNKALDAEVIFRVDDDDLRRRLQAYGADLEDLVGAGHHAFSEKSPEGPAVEVRVVDRRADYQACARSWKRRPDVGDDPQYPDLCLRDARAVRAAGRG